MLFWSTYFAHFPVLRYHSEREYNLKLSELKKKLLHYCNPAGPPLGNEHNEPVEYAQFKLKQVQVVARHGDRSSVVEKFPNLMDFNCEIKSRNSQHAQKLAMLRKTEKYLKLVVTNGRDEMVRNFLLTERKICRPGR